ncbi:MAG TPA: ATP-binding protein, partial [Thermoplasmata archaeon]|nr:ATP-binding protein [Thermoplasmata archaeon]
MANDAEGLARLPPIWGLLPFAALTLAVAGGVEALVLGGAPLSEVWPLHLILVSASGLAVALPVYYHVSRYKRSSESALEAREATLSRMNEYIINASDNFPHGMAIFDRERKMVFANRAMHERFPDSRSMVCPALLADGGEGGCAECLVPLVLRDREPRVQQARIGGKEILIHGSWIRSPGGKEYVMEVFTDITELERTRKAMGEMEIRVQRADKLATLGQLAAGVAHEMNTPLANINLLTELMERRDLDADTHRKLTEVRHQVEVAAKTVKELLDFVRDRSPSQDTVDLNELIREAAWFVRQKRSRQSSLSLDLHDSPLAVTGDGRQLQQVMINLVNNAYDAISTGGRIDVASRPVEGGFVELRVADDGRGMSVEEMEKAFEPFFTTKGEAGTGLGLAICKDIVDRHGGSIKIYSLPGEGTTVRVRLPVAEARS